MITGSPAPLCTTVSGATTCSLTVSQIGAPPVAVTVSNGHDPDAPQTYPLTATIDGSASVSGALGLLYFGAFGQQPNDTYPTLAYVDGSPVTVTNNADLSLFQAAGSPPGFNVSYANGNLTQVYLGSGGGATCVDDA